ncbi:MAG: hypothetical protein EHM56_13340 [Chloroflexi bacterium]|nr:MAG: hypothetical protein EHM56_13340 [Chloroflexota bacterium]
MLAFLGGMWIPIAPLTFQEATGGELAIFRTEAGTPEGRVTYLIRGELAYEKPPWYRQTIFHFGLLAGCLLVFLSSLLGWPVASLIRRRRSQEPTLPPRGARWVGWAMSATSFGFVLSFVAEVYENDVLLYGLTSLSRVILILPQFEAILAVMALILVCAAWLGWGAPGKRPYWSLPGRLHYTLLALAGVAFLWWLGYWNLLGSG